jgi:hypothetical protein
LESLNQEDWFIWKSLNQEDEILGPNFEPNRTGSLVEFESTGLDHLLSLNQEDEIIGKVWTKRTRILWKVEPTRRGGKFELFQQKRRKKSVSPALI